MRQLGDLAIWVGLIVLTVGVVYFTPIVGDYLASENNPVVVITPRSGAAPNLRHSMLHSAHPLGEQGSMVR
ncbi:hypothetical protein [Planctomyces sp. SH-PL62]|uniref:hypothetical protein n=1 Tax=Planctomyces sp. SH-PL62 TaxID=1636152 RepID=UPI00078EA35B|nr:hypothetical protein [Planctomyces sp. SH-PL62]AMV40722.1 hypothetical protein VT85_25040 [Planctomyces sp. SH-PL62]